MFLKKEEILVMEKYRKLPNDDKFRVQGYVDALINKSNDNNTSNGNDP